MALPRMSSAPLDKHLSFDLSNTCSAPLRYLLSIIGEYDYGRLLKNLLLSIYLLKCAVEKIAEEEKDLHASEIEFC